MVPSLESPRYLETADRLSFPVDGSVFLGVLVMEVREWRGKPTLRLRGGTLFPRTSFLRYNQRQSLDQDHRIIQHVSLTDFSCAELVFNLN
nr:hypothetical protein Iba_chr12cCG11500 [Ipomoea batatas]